MREQRKVLTLPFCWHVGSGRECCFGCGLVALTYTDVQCVAAVSGREEEERGIGRNEGGIFPMAYVASKFGFLSLSFSLSNWHESFHFTRHWKNKKFALSSFVNIFYFFLSPAHMMFAKLFFSFVTLNQSVPFLDTSLLKNGPFPAPFSLFIVFSTNS